MTTPFKASTPLLEAVTGFGAGVIFLRAATKAAATWRVAAVLVLFVFVALVGGATSAAFFFVGILAFRSVSTVACSAAAVLDAVLDVDESGPDEACEGNGDKASPATARVPTFSVGVSVFGVLAAGVLAAGVLTDGVFALAGFGDGTLAVDASVETLRTGILAAEDLTAAFVADGREAEVRDAVLPSAAGFRPIGSFAVDFTPVDLVWADLVAVDLAATVLAAVDLTPADATFFTVAACLAAAACFGLARLLSAFIPELESAFGTRAADFAAFWPRAEPLRPAPVGLSLAAEGASLGFRLREATAAFDFGGIGKPTPDRPSVE